MTTMEDLTKTQIVLLTLLVSFITSIATGIITVSLLAQAPQGVTQTIDRVVERTVERVAPTTSGGSTTREVTIVKEGDAIVSAIESTARSIVRIRFGGSFYALGAIINKQGEVITDKREVVQSGTYTVVLSDGTELPANVSKLGDNVNIAIFKIQADDAKLRSLIPISLSKENAKLGQTVVAIQGRDKTSIAVGRVVSVDGGTMTDLVEKTEIQGGPLLNLSGELIGIKSSNTDLTLSFGSYTNISQVSKLISSN